MGNYITIFLKNTWLFIDNKNRYLQRMMITYVLNGYYIKLYYIKKMTLKNILHLTQKKSGLGFNKIKIIPEGEMEQVY